RTTSGSSWPASDAISATPPDPTIFIPGIPSISAAIPPRASGLGEQTSTRTSATFTVYPRYAGAIASNTFDLKKRKAAQRPGRLSSGSCLAASPRQPERRQPAEENKQSEQNGRELRDR